MTAELRRSIFLACVGLLGGFALVVTLYGASVLFKHGIDTAEDRSVLPAPVLEVPPAPGQPIANGLAEAKPAPPPEPRPGAAAPRSGVRASAPTFDIIRVEPSGEAVIAGRATPNTTVELLRDGEPIARALVDPSGQFAIVPPALAPGSSEITLRATGADGRPLPSRESVAVVVSPGRDAKPLVALTSPDKPTVVLSQPDPPSEPKQVVAKAEEKAKPDAEAVPPQTDRAEPAAPARQAEASKEPEPTSPEGKPPAPQTEKASGTVPVKVVSVEAEEGGRLYVTGQAQPGATVRLYLNDTAVAPASVGADGRFAFTIGRGVQPGAYAVRVDEVDPVSGRVKTRSEVPFTVPAPKPVAAKPEPAKPEPAKPEPAKPAPKVALLAPPALDGSAPPAELPKLPQALAIPPALPPVDPVPPAQTPLAAEPKAGPAPKSEPQLEAKAERKPKPEVEAKAETRPKPEVEAKAETKPKPEVEAKAEPQVAQKVDPTPRPDGPPAVFVPEIGTARIVRGDSLWQISRRIYGRGTRYTVIYDANQPQIRNPDRIFPGQIFVLPSDGTAAAAGGDRRG
ncbi:LysM peptidoglycan-binding domain-containing protein [Methylobacterium gossipiicola]|uniref:LysM domain-containing protein n=1 Tax=Methylobacterium gossipiicola TaxID=582675 RepID=A0A1I2WML7_9HYPH|nr:LysM peptidoglycan-binding domain-containing protein [Methylobacterium gossipiicola]SFH02515.1 LysM domain-containing protein [Methylobacterium gossipiicola]